MSSMRRTQSSRRASVPTSTFVSAEQRASSGRVPGKYHRASTGTSDFSLPRIPQANAGVSKFWSIDEDSTQPGAELPQAAPRRKKKDRNTSARSNTSNVSSASAASRARLEKPKAWGEVSHHASRDSSFRQRWCNEGKKKIKMRKKKKGGGKELAESQPPPSPLRPRACTARSEGEAIVDVTRPRISFPFCFFSLSQNTLTLPVSFVYLPHIFRRSCTPRTFVAHTGRPAPPINKKECRTPRTWRTPSRLWSDVKL